MIAEGRFPLPGERSDHGRAPRVGDGLIRLDADGIVTYASPNALSAYRRLGPGRRPGRRRTSAELTAELVPAARPVDEALARGRRRPRRPRETEVGDGATAWCSCARSRCKPAGQRIGALVLRARRHRAAPPRARAADQGRDHPRDPPPGEEQPADGGRAAAAAGPAAWTRPRRGRRWRRRSAGSARSRSCTRRCRQRSDETVAFDEIADRVLAMVADVARRSGRRCAPRRHGIVRRCCPPRSRRRWRWC